ncbi:MAG: hypothetical protein ACRDC7_00865 [Aeromonas veronii]
MKILMSRENPQGHKLEELLEALQVEIEEKTSRLAGDNSEIAQHVRTNNAAIIGLLATAELLQRDSYRQMGLKSPPPGPAGAPRIGH